MDIRASLYDERMRSIFLQFFVVLVVVLIFSWMAANAIENLQKLGITQGFGFLSRTSFYDINQSLIEYDSTSSHGRAALVGLINTLLVAFVGIVVATCLGFLVGIMRLSHNWLVSKIASVYVECIRNTPVLIQIVLWQSIILTLPGVRSSLSLLDFIFLSNRGMVAPKPIFGSNFFWVDIAFLLGCVMVYLNFRKARKVRDETGQVKRVLWQNLSYLILFPLLVFFALGMPLTFDVPELSKFNFKGGMVVRTEFISLCTALSIYTSSFIAEIVRSGILAISRGQTEASLSLGLSKGQTMWLVIIPQAMRVIIPPLTSQYLNLTKNSSLAIAVGYMDITATLGGITLNQTGQAIECMFLLLLFYLSISVTVSLFMNWFNFKVSLTER